MCHTYRQTHTTTQIDIRYMKLQIGQNANLAGFGHYVVIYIFKHTYTVTSSMNKILPQLAPLRENNQQCPGTPEFL